MDSIIEEVLAIYPRASRIAVENFCFSAPEDKDANLWNLTRDAQIYEWDIQTIRAIRKILKTENKI